MGLGSGESRRGQDEDSYKQVFNLRQLFKAGLNLCIMILIHIIILSFIPSVIYPFSFFQFWTISNIDWMEWWTIGKPLFAWGSGLSITLLIINHYFSDLDNLENLYVFLGEPLLKINEIAKLFFIIILSASMEEIYFRWLLFLDAMIFIKSINFLCFGWMGFGIWEFIHNYIFGPICNWITFGYLDNYLINKELWFVGASMIATNTVFRDGHSYQGLVGWINSWFLGIFLFWVTFNYGLLAAIFIHCVYNIIVMSTQLFCFYLFERFNY